MNSTSPTPAPLLASATSFPDPEPVDGTATTSLLTVSNASSSIIPSKAPLVEPFPWMASLVKSSALLAGSLAKTMVNSKSEQDATSINWSKLCRKGVDRRYFPIFTRRGLSTPTSTGDLSPLAPVPPLIKSPSFDELCEELRKFIASEDMSYFVVVKQFKASTDELHVFNFEKMFFAAALKHDGLTTFAALYTSKPHFLTVIPPAFLVLTWRVVSEATKWLWSRRSQIKSVDSAEANEINAKIDSLFKSTKATLSLIQLLS